MSPDCELIMKLTTERDTLRADLAKVAVVRDAMQDALKLATKQLEDTERERDVLKALVANYERGADDEFKALTAARAENAALKMAADVLTTEVEHLQQRLRTFSDEEEATVARLRAEVADNNLGFRTQHERARVLENAFNELREAAERYRYVLRVADRDAWHKADAELAAVLAKLMLK